MAAGATEHNLHFDLLPFSPTEKPPVTVTLYGPYPYPGVYSEAALQDVPANV